MLIEAGQILHTANSTSVAFLCSRNVVLILSGLHRQFQGAVALADDVVDVALVDALRPGLSRWYLILR